MLPFECALDGVCKNKPVCENAVTEAVYEEVTEKVNLSLSRLFLLTNFVKCTPALLNLNSKGTYSSSESAIQFRRCIFTFFVKHEIRHNHVVVVQKRQRNLQKRLMHMQSCYFTY